MSQEHKQTMQTEQLKVLLKRHKLPLEVWGKGGAKTLGHFQKELESGESVLTESEGKLIRNIQTVAINIYYRDPVGTLLLVERKQVFVDGRIRRRNLSTSLGEKIKVGEKPSEAVIRAIAEELGIKEEIQLNKKGFEIKQPEESRSLPGLMTINTLHYFDVFIQKESYKTEGYIEKQKDKTTYFIWRKI